VPGIAQGPIVSAALERVGVIPDAYTWRWFPGLQGGVYEPHRAMNGRREREVDEFEVLPRQDVNYQHCMCQLQIRWRDTRTGRFTRPTEENPNS
jgi:hypothetical protein